MISLVIQVFTLIVIIFYAGIFVVKKKSFLKGFALVYALFVLWGFFNVLFIPFVLFIFGYEQLLDSFPEGPAFIGVLGIGWLYALIFTILCRWIHSVYSKYREKIKKGR